MERRTCNFETIPAEIRTDLGAIRLDLAEIKTRVSKLPTIRQWIFIQTALVLAVFTAWGLLLLV
jgi:hypothetical protein